MRGFRGISEARRSGFDLQQQKAVEFYFIPWRSYLKFPRMAVAFIVLAIFAGASFFFALAETALFALGKWQVRQMEQTNSRTGKVISGLLARSQDLLATIVLGNSFANAGIVAVVFWMTLTQNWPLTWTLVAMLAFVLFVCEVVPKTLAVRAAEPWAVRIARPMLALQALSKPFRHVAQLLTNVILRTAVSAQPPAPLSDDEYQELLEMAFQQGALGASEKEIILQIIALDRRQAKDVMQPRSQMACIADDLTVPEMIAAARKFKHRRLPMFDETLDTIVGVLNTRSLLLDPEVDLSIAIEFPSFVPETMNLLQLLKALQRQQRGLAIVLDEFGGTAGIVTIEDILTAVIGKIRRDRGADSALIKKLGDGKWRVSGTVRIDDFRREYPGLGDMDDCETLGGIVLNRVGVVPAIGEAITFRGLRMTVQTADERRIRELEVEVVRKK
jgi:putative hemolysin